MCNSACIIVWPAVGGEAHEGCTDRISKRKTCDWYEFECIYGRNVVGIYEVRGHINVCILYIIFYFFCLLLPFSFFLCYWPMCHNRASHLEVKSVCSQLNTGLGGWNISNVAMVTYNSLCRAHWSTETNVVPLVLNRLACFWMLPDAPVLVSCACSSDW